MRLHQSILVVAIFSTVFAGAPALADSCTVWKATCLGSYNGMDQAGAIKKCTDAANVCRVQCKKGQKVFIGPFNGAHHPVDSCS